MKNLILIFAIFIISTASSADFTSERNMNLDASGIKELRVECGAGFLKINGMTDAREITVQAEIILDDVDTEKAEEFLEKYLRLELTRSGDKALLRSEINSDGSFFGTIFGDNPGGLVNLTVQIPKSLNLEVDDGSGYITMKDIDGDIVIDDGSGEITITRVNGSVRLDDGSGEIFMEDIGGDVFIDDGSGEITLRKIGGNVRIDDGSGSIDIDGVEKDVTIIDAGSGGENIRNVKGRVVSRD